MSRYRFEVATEADDADLRRILADTPTPGRIAVSYRREPSYFAAATVDGDFRQVVAARDSTAGRIVGFGSRSVRMRYVNGRPRPIGYLSSLRLLPQHRNRGLVARGYSFFRELHRDGRTPLYLTTIAEGNDTAMQLLTSRRAGLPAYHDAGEYHTLAIPISRRRPSSLLRTNIELRPAMAEELPAVVKYLAEHGPQRQYFPCYAAEDFFHPAATFRDLATTDLLLAVQNGQIVGTLGAWNQQRFKQSVVEGYSGTLRWGRTVYNGWSWLRGRPPLPAVQAPFVYRTGALPVVAGDDADVFKTLLDGWLARLAGSQATHLLLGFHARDPLIAFARPYAVATYTSRLYLVCWDDGESLRSELDDLPPYLELGCL